MINHPPRRAVAAFLLAITGACFPTFQSARIEPGLRVDAGATMLADQVRNGVAQGDDYFLYAGPVYGFGRVVELGVPIGVYFEDGLTNDGPEIGAESRQLIPMPYIKVGMLDPGGRDHLAFIMQAAYFIPANVGLRYGRDLGRWTPQVGISWIFSAGPAGDDPFVPRYQEAGQSMVAISMGGTFHTTGRPSFEVGVLRNRYREGAVFGDFGQETVTRTLWDAYAGLRIGAF